MKNESWALALRVMSKLAGWIAFPVILGTFLGQWLDKKFGTEPWLFLTTIGVCFLVSMYGLVINALKEFKKIEREAEENKLAANLAAQNTKESDQDKIIKI